MKTIKKSQIPILLLIFLILKRQVFTTELAPIIILIFGLALSFLYYQFFSILTNELKISYRKTVLAVVAINEIVKFFIISSPFIGDLIVLNQMFMYLLILVKLSYLITIIYLLINSNKKYLILLVLYLLVAILNEIEILSKIENIIEIIAIIYFFIVNKIGAIKK